MKVFVSVSSESEVMLKETTLFTEMLPSLLEDGHMVQQSNHQLDILNKQLAIFRHRLLSKHVRVSPVVGEQQALYMWGKSSRHIMRGVV